MRVLERVLWVGVGVVSGCDLGSGIGRCMYVGWGLGIWDYVHVTRGTIYLPQAMHR